MEKAQWVPYPIFRYSGILFLIRWRFCKKFQFQCLLPSYLFMDEWTIWFFVVQQHPRSRWNRGGNVRTDVIILGLVSNYIGTYWDSFSRPILPWIMKWKQKCPSDILLNKTWICCGYEAEHIFLLSKFGASFGSCQELKEGVPEKIWRVMRISKKGIQIGL